MSRWEPFRCGRHFVRVGNTRKLKRNNLGGKWKQRISQKNIWHCKWQEKFLSANRWHISILSFGSILLLFDCSMGFYLIQMKSNGWLKRKTAINIEWKKHLNSAIDIRSICAGKSGHSRSAGARAKRKVKNNIHHRFSPLSTSSSARSPTERAHTRGPRPPPAPPHTSSNHINFLTYKFSSRPDRETSRRNRTCNVCVKFNLRCITTSQSHLKANFNICHRLAFPSSTSSTTTSHSAAFLTNAAH